MKSQLLAIPKQLAWTPWIERVLDHTSLRRSPVVAIAPKNVPERLRHRYAGRGQLTVLSVVLVF
jgi:hypothetical protein